jgi:hypothetical protein
MYVVYEWTKIYVLYVVYVVYEWTKIYVMYVVYEWTKIYVIYVMYCLCVLWSGCAIYFGDQILLTMYAIIMY